MHRIEYFLVKSLFWLFNRMSFKGGKRAAGVVYFLVAHVFRYRRQVILNNLRLVYGDRLPGPQKQLLKNIYRNFVFLWMEFLQIPSLTRENLDQRIHFHNIELLDQVLAQGNGLILLSGHFGNFEWLAHYFGLKGYKVSGIVKHQSNPYVDRLVESMRTRNGARLIYTKNAMAEGTKVLEQKEILALVADQDARHKGVFVDFMGVPSSTPVGPAVFRLRSGAPMYFIISIRKDYGEFDVWMEPVLPDFKKDEVNDRNIFEITQKHTTVLEKWVRKYPEQWFWVHRRWKTRPDTNR